MPSLFYDHSVKSGLLNKRKLSAFIDMLVTKYVPAVKSLDLNFIFCNDPYLLEMNKKYLDHDTFTDIITFDMSEGKDAIDGEIYISIERVRENAGTFRTTYLDELHRVIFHGVLHLCGFKDKKEKDQKIMRENEDYCLAQYKEALKK